MEAITQLLLLLGKDNVVVRYDSIFISDKYSLAYHIKAFQKLCKNLEAYISTLLISFLDDYKNVRKNKSILNY